MNRLSVIYRNILTRFSIQLNNRITNIEEFCANTRRVRLSKICLKQVNESLPVRGITFSSRQWKKIFNYN